MRNSNSFDNAYEYLSSHVISNRKIVVKNSFMCITIKLTNVTYIDMKGVSIVK
jgi:hypothetical protein